MKAPFLKLLFILGVSALALPAAAVNPRPLLRFPNIHGDQLVFVHGEDVWTAPAEGGRALRLTDDPGQDSHPFFSPDGSKIAFSSEAGGNSDVWVMNSDGSNRRRLTFHPGPDEVLGWQPVSGKILFRSGRLSWNRFDRLFVISPDGSGLEVLPLHEAARGAYSPDASKIVYNRVSREDRTWKHYRGGLAQDLWLYDFATKKDRKLTDFPGTDHLPMWIGDRIYFASDRAGKFDLYSSTPEGADLRQETHSKDWDILRPSSDGVRIVYEKGGDLWIFDPSTKAESQVDIVIPTPASETLPYRRKTASLITDAAVSPGGGRALISARGEVFTIPVAHGETRNLSRTPGARERHAVWSPDGKTIAWFSDADGEMDVWIRDADSDAPAHRISDLGPGFRHNLRFSPDARLLAFGDQKLQLLVLNISDGTVKILDKAPREPMDTSLENKEISDFAFSTDSQYIAWARVGEDMVSHVFIADLETGAKHDVSDGRFNDFGPCFSTDGRHLFFLSNRSFEPTLGDFEWEMVYKNMTRIYALRLQSETPRVFPLLSDGVKEAEITPETPKQTPKIDWAGLKDRIEVLPPPPGNYRRLRTDGKSLFFLNSERGDYNPFEFRPQVLTSLGALDLRKGATRTLREGLKGYELAADTEHILWRSAHGVGIDSSHSLNSKSAELNLKGMVTEVVPRAEWRQIFNEAWRMERDYFYDPNMRGLDWKMLGKKYGKLVDRATCPQDMEFIIGELIGELGTSHSYVYAGDAHREAEGVNVGMLGADFSADQGAWRFNKIYRIADWSRQVFPPLMGKKVSEGDYLLAVNGVPVNDHREVYAWFQGLAGQQVRLKVNSTPEEEGAREVRVKTIRSEYILRYQAWVEHNRHIVDAASGGKIGYIHFPDTYLGSATEFPRQYYSQVKKAGLIIDGRYNAGGLDPFIFLNRLARKPISYWSRRYSEDQRTPWYVSNARMVCLTNRQAGSGGDELPYTFRFLKMGPIIGTRTWGGLVGYSADIDLMDGSGLTAPNYRIYTPDSKWIIENVGVIPDIQIDNDPAEMMQGHDAQLEKAIQVLMEEIQAQPLTDPTHPPIPRISDEAPARQKAP